MWKVRNAYNILVVNLEVKRPLKRPRHRKECNTKMDLRDMFWVVDWINLAQDRD
jgi:hypothetical protein